MKGSVVVHYKWLREWPVAFPTAMFAQRVGEAVLNAEALSDGSISFKVVYGSGQRAAITSIPIKIQSKRLIIGVSWDLPEDFTIFVNGIHIASLKPVVLPSFAELPELPPRKAKDFSGANQDARISRAREEVARVARPGFRLRTLEEEVNFLHSATLQLQELVAALGNGADYHLFGAFALIRALIARGGRNFQPLLQRVAGRIDRPLLLYAPIYEYDAIGAERPDTDYRFDVQPEREVGDEAEIDLDVWLTTAGVTKAKGETASQNDVIRLFADAAGSHFDPDAAPNFDEIEAITIYRGGEPASMMLAYAAQIATCVCHLGKQIIETARR